MLSTKEGNRPLASDIIIFIGTGQYQPPELQIDELLAKPHSPIHVFQIIVGKTMPDESMFRKLQFAATTAHLAVANFDSLSQLVDPLCESVQSFLGNKYI